MHAKPPPYPAYSTVYHIIAVASTPVPCVDFSAVARAEMRVASGSFTRCARQGPPCTNT